MVQNEIDLSIILITWKMRDFLKVCLTSIFKYTSGLSYEVILIDNHSEDGTLEMIEENFPDIHLIKNSENKGVAPARNQGLKETRGRYILILDADMELTENSILKLYQFMEENKECGMVGAKLVDSNKNLQYSCKRFPPLLALIFRRLEQFSVIRNSEILNHHLMRDWDHNSIREVDYLIGACQFFRKEVKEKIGLYDDNIFYGPEDIDYSLRIWKAGWKIFYYPLTQIVHYEQRITKKNPFSLISFKHLAGIFYIYKKYGGKLSIDRKNE